MEGEDLVGQGPGAAVVVLERLGAAEAVVLNLDRLVTVLSPDQQEVRRELAQERFGVRLHRAVKLGKAG